MPKFWRKMFGGGSPTPKELAKNLSKYIKVLIDKPEAKPDKKENARKQLACNLSAAKFVLYGDTENQVDQEQIKAFIPKLLEVRDPTSSSQDEAQGMLAALVFNLPAMDFESKKDTASIFNYIMRRANKYNAVEYVLARKGLLQTLVEGYKISEVAVNCGTMLREVLRSEKLTNEILNNDELFKQFFDYVQYPNFDVASDAFQSFKLLLTKHKALAAKYLEDNYDAFFEQYLKLINSHNYVTRRQSLKLLGEILLDRSNFNVMMKYINERNNLKLMMTLLKAKSKAIQFEAFHVFKVFVANPNKAEKVKNVLLNNRDKLISFLEGFLNDRDDEQFKQEKQILLEHLGQMKIEEVAQDDTEQDEQKKPDDPGDKPPETGDV